MLIGNMPFYKKGNFALKLTRWAELDQGISSLGKINFCCPTVRNQLFLTEEKRLTGLFTYSQISNLSAHFFPVPKDGLRCR